MRKQWVNSNSRSPQTSSEVSHPRHGGIVRGNDVGSTYQRKQTKPILLQMQMQLMGCHIPRTQSVYDDACRKDLRASEVHAPAKLSSPPSLLPMFAILKFETHIRTLSLTHTTKRKFTAVPFEACLTRGTFVDDRTLFRKANSRAFLYCMWQGCCVRSPGFPSRQSHVFSTDSSSVVGTGQVISGTR